MITKTEDGLRDLIDSVLTRTYGTKWENDPQIGWSNDKKRDLEGRRKDRQLKFLYYGYVYHLNYLIEKNDLVFKLELDNIRKVTTYLEILGENRNLLMHSDDVDEYQKYLCLGICGYLQQIIKKWKLGYKRKAKRWEADIRLPYSESVVRKPQKKKRWLMQWLQN